MNKDQVLEIARLAIKWDEENSIEKRKDIRYKKVWKITERKEGQANKEQVQEIVLSDIVVKDESTDRKKEVRAQRDNKSTNEYDDEYTSEQELFWAIRLRDSQVISILDRGFYEKAMKDQRTILWASCIVWEDKSREVS